MNSTEGAAGLLAPSASLAFRPLPVMANHLYTGLLSESLPANSLTIWGGDMTLPMSASSLSVNSHKTLPDPTLAGSLTFSAKRPCAPPPMPETSTVCQALPTRASATAGVASTYGRWI
ncbi:hypothetical protein D3C72_1379940 [compost metagenome]